VVTTLSAEQIARYKRDGYLSPLRIMSNDEATRRRRRFEALEASLGEGNDLPRPLRQYLRINAHVVLGMAVELARDPRILDAIEGVIGPNILVWGCEFFVKEANTPNVVSWHQDLTYWGLGETDHEVTAWLALSPATSESGCMRFVAGSHQSRIVRHNDTFADDNLLSRGQELAVDVDEADAVHAALQPGEMSLHHGRMFHASGPNVSDDRRIGVAVRYLTTEVKQQVAARDYAMHVRGVDRERNFIGLAGPARDFEPSALALYERILKDQSAALSEGAEQNLEFYEVEA